MIIQVIYVLNILLILYYILHKVINVERMKAVLGKKVEEMGTISYMEKWLERTKDTCDKELSCMENIEDILRTMDESEHMVCY